MGNNRTTVLGNNRPANRQSKTSAAGAGFGCAALDELVEDALQFIFRNTYPLIDDADG